MKSSFAVLLAFLLLTGCASRALTPAESESASSTQSESVSEAVESEVQSEPVSEESETESLAPLPLTADFDALAELSTDSVTWGPSTFQDENGRSTACEGLQEEYGDRYGAYFIGPEDSNTVTLTFDQGYENGYTASILDTLKEKGVTAVFFLTGHYVRTQPELVQRMIDEGHILGSHSDSHKVYCRELTPEESLEDASGLQQILRDDFGYEMRLFRFPEGEFSEQSLALLQQMGYHSVFWSFAYSDWDVNNQPDEAAAKERIYKYLHPGEIMLLHSVSSTNAAILGDVIDEIRSRGLEAAPFDGLLK